MPVDHRIHSRAAACRRAAPVGRWMPAVAGAGVLAVVIIAGISGSGGATSADTVPTTVASSGADVGCDHDAADRGQHRSGHRQDQSRPAPSPRATPATTSRAVQQRLTDLGFAPGPIDGLFGSGTQQAVWAYEKLILKTPRAQAKGRVTNEMWQVMQDHITIPPRRPTGAGSTHVEIYVPEEVLIVFKNDVPELIAHISTGEQNPDGTPKKWCDTLTYDTGPNGEPLARTRHQAGVRRCQDSWWRVQVHPSLRGQAHRPAGRDDEPVYFNYGIAMHGADNVPLEPASHGCVRLNQTIAKFFPSMVAKGDLVYVWGQDGKEPEQYSRRDSLPSFNYADPDATTTTTDRPPRPSLRPRCRHRPPR